MSPILLRPVREQLEHDRIIRLLYARARRRFQVGMNPGAELNVAVGAGEDAVYPDLVLASPERGHRLQAVVEVETGESVNNLEALAEWARMAQLRAAFHLYVPAGAVEAARRLCDDHGIIVQEIWTYRTIGDQMRFMLAHRAPLVKRAAASASAKKARAAKPAQRKARPKGATKRKAAPRKPARSAKSARRSSKPPARRGGRAKGRR